MRYALRVHPLPPGRILLAFSGGPDSVGLAAALNGHDIHLAYCDHRLRGVTASRAERALVVQAAAALGRPLHRVRLTCGQSEASARNARYEALYRVADKHGCVGIALAHSADDLAETILLNLWRGSGLRGLASLRPAVTIGGHRRLRPALDVRRADLRAHGALIRSVSDPTNRSCGQRRARLRALLMPALARLLGEDPVPLLCGLAQSAAALRSTLEERANARAPDAVRATLLGEPPSSFPYLVEVLRGAAGQPGPPLTRNAYGSLHDFLRAGRTGRRHRTPGGETWCLERGGAIRVERTDRD
ncbi:MAG: tRNA lysidine(34) synthetase TilS [Planctomycetota bacterium]